VITKDGKIAFKVLEKQDVELDCNENDVWVRALLVKAAPHEAISGLSPQDWAHKAHFQAHLKASRLVAQSEYQVEGNFQSTVPGLCGRCGDPLDSHRSGEFSVYFQIVDEEKAGEDSGDADLVLTSAADIDIQALLAEQFMIQEPMVEQHPEGTCQAPQTAEAKIDLAARPSAFERLKGLKFD
jgi:uncharacterized metal-binding protein YceD (DUF177 family)